MSPVKVAKNSAIPKTSYVIKASDSKSHTYLSFDDKHNTSLVEIHKATTFTSKTLANGWLLKAKHHLFLHKLHVIEK